MRRLLSEWYLCFPFFFFGIEMYIYTVVRFGDG